MIEYPIPGAWVREFTVEVPLDWADRTAQPFGSAPAT
jgi:hypothetical protein